MRLIDADAVAEAIREALSDETGGAYFTLGLSVGLAHVTTAETVEAVQVVRCKDCKYRKVSEYHYKDIGYRTTECTRGNEGVIGTCEDSGYCSDGERRDEDDE